MSCCEPRAPQRAPSRRGVLSAAVGAAGLAWAGKASASGHAEVLLLTCMDYRLVNEVEAYMTARGLRDNYDHLIVAGASIGVNYKNDWAAVFWEHLDIAIKLHSERKLLVIDHRDCGAYKLLMGEGNVSGASREEAAHVNQLHVFRQSVKDRHPELEVELALMSLDGSVQIID